VRRISRNFSGSRPAPELRELLHLRVYVEFAISDRNGRLVFRFRDKDQLRFVLVLGEVPVHAVVRGVDLAAHEPDHKAAADIALNIAKKEGQTVDKVLVWRRHAGKNASATPFVKGRDFFVDEM